MNRKDWLPVLVIVALFFAYPVIDRKLVAKWFPAPERPAAAEAVHQRLKWAESAEQGYG